MNTKNSVNMLTNELSDDVDERIKTKYKLICEKLNIDDNVMETSWENYRSIRNDHNLEGDQIHWLCCALYIAHNKKSDAMSGISLTKLLRMCNITLYEFIKKTEQWITMVETSKECLDRFDRFRRSFSVSILLYEKYRLIFNEIFMAPDYFEESMAAASLSTPQKGKKSKQNVCTPNKVYEFCWYLFISAKSENPDNTVDLVTSFHMLLCCLDLIFVNIVGDKRDDLLNMKFEPAAKAADTESICIIRNLCEQQQTTEVDVLAIKSHEWKDLIKKYFNDGILKGNANSFMGLLTGQNYDHNLNSLKKQYELHILSVGKIDEGIFLFQPDTDITPNQTMHSQIIKTLMPETPLTRRHCLPGRDAVLASPVSMATQNVCRLHQQLNDTVAEPSAVLKDLFKACETDPFPEIQSLLKTMSEKFCAEFRTNAANERFELAVKLYYRLLENIIRNEKKKSQNFDIKILNHSKLHTTLIATSVEIVIYSFGTPHNFPWVLQTLNIDAFYFYKIIEIVVQCYEGILTRDLIKHLNAIEEQCLESLAWESSSPLWNAIRDYLSERRALPKQTELRSDSLSLFFRKFYKLAFIRIEKLSIDLELALHPNLQKIWTTFEYSICHHSDLMKDRHLDQLLMCSIYIFARARKLPTKFKDIMTVYRTQPQAKSHIYREVLGIDNERCDIIKFYNNIYVKAMQEFVLHLKDTEDVSLSPLPCRVRFQQSPRKISKNHQVFVSELQTNETLKSNELISFTFNASPIQDLKKINKIVSEGLNSNGKRTVSFAGFDQQAPKIEHEQRVPYTNKNLQSLMTDRQENSDK